jgi:hypothetical protein
VALAALIVATDPPMHVYGIRALNDGPVVLTVTGAIAEVEGATEHLGLVRFVHHEPGPLPHLVGPGERWEGLADDEQFREGVSKLKGAGSPPWRTRVGVHDAGHVLLRLVRPTQPLGRLGFRLDARGDRWCVLFTVFVVPLSSDSCY